MRSFELATATIVFLILQSGLTGCTTQGGGGLGLLDSPSRHLANGQQLMQSGKLEAAEREFRRAVELAPDYAAAYVNLGVLYAMQGGYDTSRQALQRAEELAEQPDAHLAAALGWMRLCLLGREQVSDRWFEKLTEAFQEAQRLDPNAAGPVYYMGQAQKQTGDYAAAAASFTRVVRLGDGFVSEARREIQDLAQHLRQQGLSP